MLFPSSGSESLSSTLIWNDPPWATVSNSSFTPGGWLMSARVVNSLNQPPTLIQAMWRFVAAAITLIPIGSGYWMGRWNDERRTWFDRLSGTKVVGDNSFLPPGEVKF